MCLSSGDITQCSGRELVPCVVHWQVNSFCHESDTGLCALIGRRPFLDNLAVGRVAAALWLSEVKPS